MQLKVKKLRESSKMPHQTHETDAGYDLFYCSDEVEEQDRLESQIFIDAGQSKLIPTGLSFEFDKDYVIEVKNRSSVASKLKLVVGACIIDSGYRGEVFVNLINVGNGSCIIKNGDKIAQFVIYKVEKAEIIEAFDLSDSSRGSGGFGSTGK